MYSFGHFIAFVSSLVARYVHFIFNCYGEIGDFSLCGIFVFTMMNVASSCEQKPEHHALNHLFLNFCYFKLKIETKLSRVFSALKFSYSLLGSKNNQQIIVLILWLLLQTLYLHLTSSRCYMRFYFTNKNSIVKSAEGDTYKNESGSFFCCVIFVDAHYKRTN